MGPSTSLRETEYLVFFGAPSFLPDHARLAVACGISRCRKRWTELNKENRFHGVTAASNGHWYQYRRISRWKHWLAETERNMGAVGSPINIAFRVQARAAGGEILVTPRWSTKALPMIWTSAGPETTNSKVCSLPLTIYQVIALKARNR